MNNIVTHVRNLGWGVVDLDGLESESIQNALGDIKQKLQRSHDRGRARLRLPVSCLKLHISPHVRSIFSQLLGTSKMLNTFEFAQYVPNGQRQTYVGQGLMGLLALTEQTVKGKSVQPGQMIMYYPDSINAEYLFQMNNSGADWIGLFIGYSNEANVGIERINRVTKFLKAEYRLDMELNDQEDISDLLIKRHTLLKEPNSFHRYFIDGTKDMDDETEESINLLLQVGCATSEKNILDNQNITESELAMLDTLKNYTRGMTDLENGLMSLPPEKLLLAWERHHGIHVWGPFLWKDDDPSLDEYIDHVFEQAFCLIKLLDIVRYEKVIMHQLAFGFEHLINPLRNDNSYRMHESLWESLDMLKDHVDVCQLEYKAHLTSVNSRCLLQGENFICATNKFSTHEGNAFLFVPLSSVEKAAK